MTINPRLKRGFFFCGPHRATSPAPSNNQEGAQSCIQNISTDFFVYDQFPHMILLVQAEQPRIYAVLPMDPALLCRADEGFEMAKIFSLYSKIDVCLVLGPDKCVYIRKDGTYKRSRQRPTGGAVAHRSVTGPHLYSLHLEPLQATLRDRPDAFQWYDEFDIDPELFTSRDYSPVEPVISLSRNILDLIREQVRRAAADFRLII